MLTSLFSLFYVTREFHRFLHRGRAALLTMDRSRIILFFSELTSDALLKFNYSNRNAKSVSLYRITVLRTFQT